MTRCPTAKNPLSPKGAPTHTHTHEPEPQIHGHYVPPTRQGLMCHRCQGQHSFSILATLTSGILEPVVLGALGFGGDTLKTQVESSWRLESA